MSPTSRTVGVRTEMVTERATLNNSIQHAKSYDPFVFLVQAQKDETTLQNQSPEKLKAVVEAQNAKIKEQARVIKEQDKMIATQLVINKGQTEIIFVQQEMNDGQHSLIGELKEEIRVRSLANKKDGKSPGKESLMLR